jgi:thymidine phosphorylase
MGAGRTSAEQSIDPAVGIELVKVVGDAVSAKEPIAYLHVHEKSDAKTFLARTSAAFVITPRKPQKAKLLLERLEGKKPSKRAR